ncbi:MAG: multiheme c-type cytochrome [Planctomycetota bacterium]
MPAATRRRLRWPWLLGAIGLLGIAGGIYADWHRTAPTDALTNATYVGRQSCVDCHQQEHADWTGSHHDLAMDVATDESVLGDFNDVTYERLGVTTRFFRDGERFMVNTEGPDGEYADFEVKYTFGVDPLQQYMIEFEDGRVQVLRVSWDTHRGEWFYVYPPDVVEERIEPGDPLHWTGITQNWNTTCAICHSTNLQKNYDLATNTYETTYSEIDVSCEECHGPASLHVELATANSLFWDRQHGYGLAKLKSPDATTQIETCAKCHSRRNAVHGDFRPGTPLLDVYEPALLREGLYHADGQILDEVYVYGSFVQSKMHAKGVRCTDCHNPHSLELEHPGNAMCAKCHEPAKYDVAAHHHHQAGTPGAQCVDCHMPASTYMVVDPRRDHSFRVPRPDLTVSTGSPNACNGCHTGEEETAEWAAAKVVEWYGDQRDNGDPSDAWHWAPAIAAGRSAEAEGESLLAKAARKETAPAIVQATAIELLQQYPGNGATETIAKALNSTDPLVRLAAVRGTFPTSVPAAKKLADRLDDPAMAVRIAAARRLVGVPPGVLTPEQLDDQIEVLDAWREQQAMQNEHAGTHQNLANLALELGDRDTAIDELRIAVRLEPYRSGPRGQLASLLESTGSASAEVTELRQEEIELLERDADFLPDDANIRYRLGLLRYQVGELAAAEQALSKAADLAGENYDYVMALALVQEQRYANTGEQKHLKAAAATLKRLNALDPTDRRAEAILRRLLATQRSLEASKQ